MSTMFADVAGVDPRGQLLRRGQDGRDRLLIVLEVPQILLAQRAVVGSDAVAVVRVLARLHLVDAATLAERPRYPFRKS